ncbi:hypothetical protein FF125_06510 [Aureibaculum algae]|uniref:Outer membrane protein beta-barrel domain-containing protein n=1 Tax=Aureibaculum algae TaxID=2584122 RepID=A0A5B7TSJ7_9FLAO|nr:hypothetical protein [Aureibaculum algae]QCX38096.1 hypothetical protein FF125_06510 [Aureibaculum algae]
MVNSSKTSFLLVEYGNNEVNSKTQIHFGIGAEYSLTKKSSFTIRVKYFKTGIDHFAAGYGSFFSIPSTTFLYEGEVLKVPINYKFGGKLFFNGLNYFVAAGPALNITVKEEVIEVYNLTASKHKTYFNLNTSVGLLYDVSPKLVVSLSLETYRFGNEKTEEVVGFIFSSGLETDEGLINIGVRFKL